MCLRHELSENVLVEGTLRLEYGKSGIYDNNRLPAKKKKKEKEKEEKENTRDRSVPDGSDKYLGDPSNPPPSKGNMGYLGNLTHLPW